MPTVVFKWIGARFSYFLKNVFNDFGGRICEINGRIFWDFAGLIRAQANVLITALVYNVMRYVQIKKLELKL